MSVMVKTFLAMDGEAFTKALEEAVPELQAAEQAAQTPQAGGPVAPGPGAEPQAGAGDAQVQAALLRAQPSPSRQQVFVNQGR
jgi:hypothetical protein